MGSLFPSHSWYPLRVTNHLFGSYPAKSIIDRLILVEHDWFELINSSQISYLGL